MSDQEVKTGGIYLESIISKVGTGSTAKDAKMENLWRAKPLDGDFVEVELFDMNDLPSGYRERVTLKEFHQRFIYQKDWKPRKQDPQKEEADRIAARGERHLANNETFSAEFEFNNALKLDESSVRANFGLGQTYMAQGEADKARQIFKKLSTIEAVMEPRHKHIFNEFGIQLRKLGMYAEAIRYYQRALNLEKNDENLWFNFGRALHDGGRKQKAQVALKRALEINSEFTEARLYIERCFGKG